MVCLDKRKTVVFRSKITAAKQDLISQKRNVGCMYINTSLKNGVCIITRKCFLFHGSRFTGNRTKITNEHQIVGKVLGLNGDKCSCSWNFECFEIVQKILP